MPKTTVNPPAKGGKKAAAKAKATSRKSKGVPLQKGKPVTSGEDSPTEDPALADAESELIDEPPGAEIFEEISGPTPDDIDAIEAQVENAEAEEAGMTDVDIAGLPVVEDEGASVITEDAPLAQESTDEKTAETVTAATAAASPGASDSIRQAGHVAVTRHFKTGGNPFEINDDPEEISVKTFSTVPAQVGVNNRMTINLGDYESAQVGVSVTLPCYVEEIEDAYAYASKFAEARMAEEVNDIRADLGKAPVGGASAAAVEDDDDDSDTTPLSTALPVMEA